jgi:hypothetical protein
MPSNFVFESSAVWTTKAFTVPRNFDIDFDAEDTETLCHVGIRTKKT